MNVWAKWKALPLKARYYIGGSTFAFALIGDYVTGRINDEVTARNIAVEEIKKD